jgi:hypothetical protein
MRRPQVVIPFEFFGFPIFRQRLPPFDSVPIPKVNPRLKDQPKWPERRVDQLEDANQCCIAAVCAKHREGGTNAERVGHEHHRHQNGCECPAGFLPVLFHAPIIASAGRGEQKAVLLVSQRLPDQLTTYLPLFQRAPEWGGQLT